MKKHILYANLFAITLLSAVTVTVRSGTERCAELSVYKNEVSKQLDCLSGITKEGLNDLRIDSSIYNLTNWHMTSDMLQDLKDKKDTITQVINGIINQVEEEASTNPAVIANNISGLQNVINQMNNMSGVVRSDLNESLLPEFVALQKHLQTVIDKIEKIATDAANNANAIDFAKQEEEQKIAEIEKMNRQIFADSYDKLLNFISVVTKKSTRLSIDSDYINYGMDCIKGNLNYINDKILKLENKPFDINDNYGSVYYKEILNEIFDDVVFFAKRLCEKGQEEIFASNVYKKLDNIIFNKISIRDTLSILDKMKNISDFAHYLDDNFYLEDDFFKKIIVRDKWIFAKIANNKEIDLEI